MKIFAKRLNINLDDAFISKSSFVHALLFLIAIILIASVLILKGYQSEKKNREIIHQAFYLEKARLLSNLTTEFDTSNAEKIKQKIVSYWESVPTKPKDEYLCIVDSSSHLIAHTLFPEIAGNYVGSNPTDQNVSDSIACLKDIVNKKCSYVGNYYSSSGEKQIAAFVQIPEMNWTLGIHRSREVYIKEVNKGLRNYLISYFFTIGLLLPICLLFAYFIFRRMYRQKEQLQRTLKNREKQYQKVYSAARDCMIVITQDGNITSANPEACKSYGYRKRDLIGKNIQILAHPSTDKTILDELKKSGFFEGETIDKKKDGELIIAESRWMQIEVDETPFFMGIIRDITQRKKDEENLKTSEERFRSLAELAPFSIAIYNSDKYLYTNKHWGEITGYSTKDIRTMKPLDLLHPKWRKIASERLEERIEGKLLPNNIELKLMSKSGEEKWVELHSKLIKHDGENAILSAAIDISNRKLKEKEANEAQARLEEIFNDVDFGIVLVSMDKKIQFANNYAIKKLGYQKFDEIYDHGCCDIFCPSKKENCPIIDKNKTFYSAETIVDTKSGGKLYVLKSTRVIDLNGEKIILESFVDISKQKEAEKQVKEYYKKLEDKVSERTTELEEQSVKYQKSQQALSFLLEDVNESRSDLEAAYKELNALNKELEAFSYSVSHDLRAPLTRMDGFSKILLQSYSEALDDKGKHYLNRIRASSQHMAQLINDLLTLSRISRKEINMIDINVSDIALNIIKELTESSPKKKIEYTVQENIHVAGDNTLMEILLRNLIENAWKFSGNMGIVKISIGQKTIKDKNTIFIKDNGVGFNMSYYGHLFKPFGRLHPDDEFVGTGIGLATVQRVINRHQGEIWAESELGKGATFYFTI